MKHHLSSLTLTLPLAFALASCAGFGQGRAPVTPQRPTLSSDTSTTAADTVEVEAGLTLDPGDRADTPMMVKWGASDQTEMLLGWSPIVNIDGGAGQDRNGTSDMVVGVRHRFLEETEDRPSAAFQIATKLPTANDEIGSGEQDFFAAAILGKEVHDVAYTAFYQLGVLGNPAGRGSDLGHDFAFAAGYGLNERWSVFGEMAGQFVPDLDLESIYTTGGVTFRASDDFVYDAGLVLGLSNDAPDLVLMIGMTHNLGRLFGAGGK